MPEGDTIFRTARTLQRALGGQVVTSFETMLPKLSRVHEDHPITGRTIEKVESHGKWLSVHFSDDLVLLTHMLMSGSWHIYRPGERWFRPYGDMRIVIGTEKMLAVAFTVPIAEFHSGESLARRKGFRDLGQDVLSNQFDAASAAAQLRSLPELELGDALLKQSFLAGIGNVYKSEICFACKVTPFRCVATLTLEEASNLVQAARKFLLANVTDKSGNQIATYLGHRRTTGRSNPSERLWVYGRSGEQCRICGTPISSRKQGPDARMTFWCPSCQR